MSDRVVGAVIGAPNPKDAVERIVEAERLGLGAAWMTSGSTGGDSVSTLAAAAAKTERILLGTAIVPIFPRHPITLAQQAQVIDSLAPGRFRLGLGASGRAGVEGTFGIPFGAPLGHMREYITIARELLQTGKVDREGRHYTAHSSIASTSDVKVMGAALGVGAFEMCGAKADGAISWICPRSYLEEVGLPALAAGADAAGRATPPLIVHAAVCVHDDMSEARQAVGGTFGGFLSSPHYASMFEAAGFPNVAERGWTDEMVDSVLIGGSEQQVHDRLDKVFEMGASEVFGSIVTAGPDEEASYDRALRALASYTGG
jgi:F420-dependent oxidoreductase-like protein